MTPHTDLDADLCRLNLQVWIIVHSLLNSICLNGVFSC